ncbi:MAG TPA: tetratricopeptide repeat protein [Myxococcota bacterium]|nr:tetratricopeptide repeat protein [Myxococcota bacterium]
MSRKRDEISESDEHNARGIELADRGWLDEAASEFQKAIKLDPNSAHAHDNLATIYAEKGQHLEALTEFMEALKVEPDSPTVHHYLASFLAAHAQDLAVAEYRKAIDLEFDFPDAHLNLALALGDRGQLEEAVLELETAHAQAPDDEMVQHELASCLIDLERYPEAIGHLKKIIKGHPEHVEAYVDLGIAYTAQGFYAEAEAVLRKALEVDSHDFSSHYHLAALYATWGRLSDALDHLETAATQDEEKTKQWLRDDRLFEPLRNEERYAKLMA